MTFRDFKLANAMIVLVGANGFLGRHMCELLERKGAPAVGSVAKS